MSALTFLDHLHKTCRHVWLAAVGRRKQVAPGFWDQLPDQVRNEARCTFVLSTGRCGTRLVTVMLNRCGNVDVNHHAELAAELQYPARLAYQREAPEVDLQFAALCCRYEPIQTSFLNDRAYVETNNRITFFAPALYEAFPAAKFIHLVRHPGSFVRSGLDAGFYAGGYYDTGRITPGTEPELSQWSDWSRLQKVAWLWNATNQFAEDFKARAAPERMMTVRAEDIFADPTVAERMIEFVGAHSLTRKRVEKLIGRRVNAKAPGGLPPFKQWNDTHKEQVRSLCTLAAEYGYEL